jgi:hypothetical protein
MDSTANLKVKTTKGKGVGACSLAHSILGVKGCVGALGWGLGRGTSKSLTQTCRNQTISWLMHSWSIFGAQTNHEQTQTHKTHHGPDFGEATTFPLKVFSMSSHEVSTQMSFCPGTPKLEFRNFLN